MTMWPLVVAGVLGEHASRPRNKNIAVVARLIASFRENGLVEHRGSEKTGGYFAIQNGEVWR